MSNLLVRNLDERIVRALKARAALHNRSAEAEHRAILEKVLFPTRRRTFAEALLEMPDLGLDSDFERVEDAATKHVFD